jgi:anti-sigma regulatory factor (Ser/Thr protein kinase)
MHELKLTLSAAETAPGAAREAVRSWLSAWCDEDTVDIATLLVTELVTNAVLHGTGPGPSLTIDRVSRGVIHVAVRDSSRQLPLRHNEPPSPDQSGGRGLFLIESLAIAWGWEPRRFGKCVWFEIECTKPDGGSTREP